MQETSKNNLETGLSELVGKAIALGRQRRFYVLVLLHLVMAGVANYSAFWLRFDGHIPPQYMELWKWGLPVLVAIRLVIFFPFRLYGGLWRYTSIHDLRRIVLAVGTGTLIFAFMEIFAGNTSYPRSVYLVDSLILIFLMGGARVGRRMLRDSRKPGKKSKTVLVYGAGDAGEMIVRDMKNNPFYDLAQKYLPKGAGAVFTFGVKGGYEAGIKLVENVQLFSHLANIGDTRSLILHPASTTHRQLTDEQRQAAGAGPDVIRLSIGLESADDLIRDLDEALTAAER